MDIKNVLTNAGSQLIASYLSDPTNPIVFTGAKIGTGLIASNANPKERTSLISECAAGINEYAIIAGKQVGENSTFTITVQFTNDGLIGANNSAIDIEEIGIFAKIGNATPILFSYLTFGDYPDTILPKNKATVERFYDIPFVLNTEVSGTVTVNISPVALVKQSETATQAAANKLLYLNANGKLPADITGDAATLGGHAASYFANSGHRHSNATSSADGFMSKTDKAAHDTLVSRVNQSVKTTDSPTFAGLTINGYIDGARFR